MTCFKVDDGGALYWVVAERAEDCVPLIEKCEGVDDSLGWDDEPPRVTAIDATEQAKTMIVDDGDFSKRVPLAVLVAKVTKPEVLACSEWP